MILKKHASLEASQARSGYLFLLPWTIGFLFFFLLPFAETVRFSFSKVAFGDAGLQLIFKGIDNYRFLFLEDAAFLSLLIGSLRNIFLITPVIVIFSLFIGLILARKFRGQTVARAVFFLPMIISSGIIIQLLKSDIFASGGMAESANLFQTDAISSILVSLGMGGRITQYITGMVAQIFDISWDSGIQIVLFIGAIQTIPASFYEAAHVEGANAWEKFWKITFPILLPFICLTVVYTVIDSFTSYQNDIMRHVYTRINANNYGLASATSLVYFLVVFVFILIIIRLFSKTNE